MCVVVCLVFVCVCYMSVLDVMWENVCAAYMSCVCMCCVYCMCVHALHVCATYVLCMCYMSTLLCVSPMCMCVPCAGASCGDHLFESVDLSSGKAGSAGHRAVCPLLPGYGNALGVPLCGWASGKLRAVVLRRESQVERRRCGSVSPRALETMFLGGAYGTGHRILGPLCLSSGLLFRSVCFCVCCF